MSSCRECAHLADSKVTGVIGHCRVLHMDLSTDSPCPEFIPVTTDKPPITPCPEPQADSNNLATPDTNSSPDARRRPKMTVATFSLTRTLLERLTRFCGITRMKKSNVVEIALEEYLDREENR